MGAHLDFQGFQKKKEFILSHNKCWDIYEVNYDKMTPFAIPNTECHIPKGLSSMHYVLANRQECYDFQLYDKDIVFHFLMPNGLAGTGSRMEDDEYINIMFGPQSLKPTFEKLLKLVDYHNGRNYVQFHDWEKQSIECVLKNLDKIIEQDGMVSLIYG